MTPDTQARGTDTRRKMIAGAALAIGTRGVGAIAGWALPLAARSLGLLSGDGARIDEGALEAKRALRPNRSALAA